MKNKLECRNQNNMAAKALMLSSIDQSDYALAEQELQDHILDVYGTRDQDEDLFRSV